VKILPLARATLTTLAAFASLAPLAMAGTDLPHGCGTFVICESKKTANGDPDGDQVCRNADNKKTIVMQAHWKKGELDRDFFCANDDGVPVAKANYKNGKLDGKYQEYDSSLKQWALEEYYKDGKKEGISRQLIPGDKTIVRFYKNGQHNGYELLIDGNGKLINKRNCHINDSYAEDKVCDAFAIPGYEKLLGDTASQEKKTKDNLDNRMVEEKYADGKIKERYKLVGGKKQGLYERYYANGKLGEKYNLVNGVKEGLYEAFFDTGVLEIKTQYLHDEKTESSKFFAEGQIEESVWYKKGMPYKVIRYYQNGKVSAEMIEQEPTAGRALGLVAFKRYHDNGQLSDKGFLFQARGEKWDNLDFHGQRELYSRSGKLLETESYENGIRSGLWTAAGNKYDFELRYDKGVKKSVTIFEKNTHKQLKKSEFLPDGSIRSEVVDPSYKEE
jgi:antitoxin component YwqK of YwqJK toxin-antitoxin module